MSNAQENFLLSDEIESKYESKIFNIELLSKPHGLLAPLGKRVVKWQALVKILLILLDKFHTSIILAKNEIEDELSRMEKNRTQYYCPYGHFLGFLVEFEEMPLSEYYPLKTTGRQKRVIISFIREDYSETEKFAFHITKKMMTLQKFAAAQIVMNLQKETDIDKLEIANNLKHTLVEAFSDNWSPKFYKANVVPEPDDKGEYEDF